MSDYEDGYLAHQNTRSHSSGHRDAYQTGKALGSLLRGGGRVGGGLLSSVGPVLADMLAAAPLLVLAFLLTAPLDFLGPYGSLPRLLAILAVGYCFYALVYCIKGLAVSLRLRGGWLWLLPLVLVVLAAVVVPALLLHQFTVRVVPNVPAVSAWGLPLVFVVVAFFRYRFLTDYAPFYALWAYRLGYGWAKK
ncbi:hypothetical protein GCM10022408_34130 [Hymenobacter fastidiosus]|uniref:Uncharacterized protein n=1 Tax=Hymenobacter fastidiosus TaxID=486264 RepID=A0ABP7SWR2_9BACT